MLLYFDVFFFSKQARAFQASSFHPDLINFAYNEAVVRSQPRAFFSAADLLYSVGMIMLLQDFY